MSQVTSPSPSVSSAPSSSSSSSTVSSTPPSPSPSPSAPPGRRSAALGRLFLGAAASLAAAAAGTLAPEAPEAYAADAMSPVTLPMPAAGPGDRLSVTVRGVGGGADGTFELRCHPGGGTHPAVRDACGRLDRRTVWGTDPFAPVESGSVCTMQYGGPATAHVTGTWAGRRVDARFDRGDGCEIARWDAMVPVLPDTGA
ncbi:hypothetical protein J8M51_39610 [Streptomyces scabiei]|nr:hypothetical protein [Streptomyces griseiscabiei]